MSQTIPPVRDPAGAAPPTSLHIGAEIPSKVLPKNRVLSAQVALPGSSDDQLEAQLLIEMRYQQHLAQQGLQEVFENGGLSFPEQ
ncbi:MAG: hypothetical protein ACREVV_08495 [Steroidobacteraceae bacterium]